MSDPSQTRNYIRADSIVFLRTNEAFGGLSNMAGGFPLRINGVRIRTSEALYQACRFPHLPHVQRAIIEEPSPMTAKMRGKPFRDDSRPDWDSVRVKIMRWCLRVKLAQNWTSFADLLLKTGTKPIVEQSRKDDFWGAKVVDDESLIGMNILGRLLMELREEVRSGIRKRATVVPPVQIPEFKLFDYRIEPVGPIPSVFETDVSKQEARITAKQATVGPKSEQWSLFDAVHADHTPLLNPPPTSLVRPSSGVQAGLENYQPYPDLRPSGLAWLGDIPVHWDVRRNGRLFGLRRETGFPDLPVLEVSLRSGVRVRDFDNGTRKQEMGDRSQYQRAVRGDIAYNMMRMWQGAVGIAPVDGLVSPAYVVARPFAETDPAYYTYVFRTAAYMREVDTFSRGIVPDRNRLYWESFKQMPSVYPPVEEQRLIVRFLDWHGVQTATLIRAKKKIIALLNEQKQAIIHRAVTRGLDPDVRLKPSGIPWLGEVPEGWEMKRLKNVCRINPSKVSIKRRSTQELATFLPMERVSSDGKIDVSIQASISELSKGFTYFERGDVILAKITPCFENGKGAVLDALPTEVGFGSTEFIVLRASREVDPRFLYLLTFEAQFRRLGVESMTGSAGQQRISQEFVANYCIALPSIDEQARIIEALKAATLELDAVIDAAKQEIALIQEFRTRLIADVVTGKLDIRAAAASLPETVDLEPTYDLVEGEDLEETVDDIENHEVAA